MADGWQESYGVKFEVAYFRETCKPVHYMMPGVVPAVGLR